MVYWCYFSDNFFENVKFEELSFEGCINTCEDEPIDFECALGKLNFKNTHGYFFDEEEHQVYQLRDEDLHDDCLGTALDALYDNGVRCLKNWDYHDAKQDADYPASQGSSDSSTL